MTKRILHVVHARAKVGRPKIGKPFLKDPSPPK